MKGNRSRYPSTEYMCMTVTSEFFPKSSEPNKPNAKHPTKVLLTNNFLLTSFCLPHTIFILGFRKSMIMSQPKFLSGDKAGIDEFLDRFDVSIR